MAIRAVYEDGRLRLLDPVDLTEGEHIDIAILRERDQAASQSGDTPSAPDLLRMPVEERNRVLEKAAERAEEDYRTDAALTDFDAYGDGDIYDETS